MQGITFVDMLIWIILLGFMAKGFMKGLVREVCSLLGLVVGGWGAFKYYPAVAESVIRPLINLPHLVASVISFLLIFVAFGILLFLLGHLLTIVFKIALLGGVNRAGGVIFGLAQGALLVCMLLYLGTTRPIPEKLKTKLAASKTALSFASCGKDIIAGWEGGPVRRMLPGPPR